MYPKKSKHCQDVKRVSHVSYQGSTSRSKHQDLLWGCDVKLYLDLSWVLYCGFIMGILYCSFIMGIILLFFFFRWLFSGYLASVPGSHSSMANLMAKGLRLWLDHLQVDELHHWHLCHLCIALELAVQFELYSSIRARTQIWVHVQPGSSSPHCTKWIDDQQSPAGLEPRLVPDFSFPKPPL